MARSYVWAASTVCQRPTIACSWNLLRPWPWRVSSLANTRSSNCENMCGINRHHTWRQERIPEPMETIHALMLGTKNAAKIHGVQAAFTDVREALEAPD